MVNINLVTNTDEKKSFSVKGGLVYALILIVIWLGAYGGIILYKNNLEGKIAALNAEEASKNQILKEENNQDIFDFQQRLTSAETLARQKDGILESLGKMQELIVSGNRLASYEYSGNKILLTGKADNYGVIARQIMNFKQSAYFSGVEVSSIEPLNEGKIDFSLSLTVN
jgi:Tfp pilus assembly protein PilN